MGGRVVHGKQGRVDRPRFTKAVLYERRRRLWKCDWLFFLCEHDRVGAFVFGPEFCNDANGFGTGLAVAVAERVRIRPGRAVFTFGVASQHFASRCPHRIRTSGYLVGAPGWSELHWIARFVDARSFAEELHVEMVDPAD